MRVYRWDDVAIFDKKPYQAGAPVGLLGTKVFLRDPHFLDYRKQP